MNNAKYVSPYLQFLCFTFLNRMVQTIDFSILAKYERQKTIFLTKAISLGHIRNIHFTEREKGTNNRKSIDGYTITKEGIRYLRNNYPHPWFATMTDEEIDVMDIYQNAEKSRVGRLRVMTQSAAVAMAMRAGAEIPLDTFTDLNIYMPQDDDGEEELDESDNETQPGHIAMFAYLKNTLTEYVYRELQYKQTEFASQEPSLVFHATAKIKQHAGQANKYSTATEYLRARMKGVIDTNTKSVFIYISPLFSMRWDKWVVTPEINAYRLWTRNNDMVSQEQVKVSGNCAGMIVKNAQSFVRLYKDAKSQSEASHGEASFGGPFDHFYIYPHSIIGADHMRWTSTVIDKDVQSAFIEYFVNEQGFSDNDHEMFSLVNTNGDKTAIAFTFDVKDLLQIERVAAFAKDENFAVVCFPWQKEYYERVLPSNVYYITAEFNH